MRATPHLQVQNSVRLRSIPLVVVFLSEISRNPVWPSETAAFNESFFSFFFQVFLFTLRDPSPFLISLQSVFFFSPIGGQRSYSFEITFTNMFSEVSIFSTSHVAPLYRTPLGLEIFPLRGHVRVPPLSSCEVSYGCRRFVWAPQNEILFLPLSPAPFLPEGNILSPRFPPVFFRVAAECRLTTIPLCAFNAHPATRWFFSLFSRVVPLSRNQKPITLSFSILSSLISFLLGFFFFLLDPLGLCFRSSVQGLSTFSPNFPLPQSLVS